MARIKCGDIHLNVTEQGQGTPLVLVHGYPLDHSMWRGQLAGLSDACRVIAPDLRGFGASDVTPGTATMEQMADDIAALLNALDVREPVVFCGLSMGGYVAWQFASRHAGRLAKLILCDTRAVADSAEAAAGRHKTAEKVLSAGAGIAAEGIIPKLFAADTYEEQPQLVEATRQVILRTNPEGIAAALRGMAVRQDFSPRLAQIDVPALVICGEHDAISPPDEMRKFAGVMPHATYVEISGAGHMSPLERPEPVNSAIREFLIPH
jgi:pimeloyl-ACP methyl ester carboxylesterase